MPSGEDHLGHHCLLSGFGPSSYVIKVIGYTFRGSNSVIFIFASLVNGRGGVYSWRKEFAPLGANSLVQEYDPFWKGFVG